MSEFEVLPTRADELGHARAFLESAFPDAVMFRILELPPEAAERAATAGFGVAEVILQATTVRATFITHRTPFVDAIERIYTAEAEGTLPNGSHEDAITSIFDGNFYFAWGEYLVAE